MICWLKMFNADNCVVMYLKNGTSMFFTRKTVATVLILSLSALVFSSMPFSLSRTSVVGVVYAGANVPVKGATVTVVGQNA